jgi:hypothetical protein
MLLNFIMKKYLEGKNNIIHFIGQRKNINYQKCLVKMK